MNNAQSTSQKVVAWARPVYARPVNAPDTGEWDELVDIEFHTRPEKPEGEGWYPLVVADTGRQSTHAPGCWSWGPRHYECAVGQIERDTALLLQALEGLRERCAQEAECITARRRAVAAMINNEAVKPCEVGGAIRKIDVQQYYECAVGRVIRDEGGRRSHHDASTAMDR